MASSSSSSAHKPNPLLNHVYGGLGVGPTSAPPPTPSSQQHPSLSSSTSSDAATADTLSRLLHRLPPNLSLPKRLSPRAAPTSSTPLTTLSLSSSSSSSSSAFELGYLQVNDDDMQYSMITPQLAESAESESLSLFELSLEDKLSSFPKDWPLGFNFDDDDDHQTGSFCFHDSTLDSTKSELRMGSLAKLSHELERLGLEILERIACAVGFENPFKESVGPKPSSLMWVSSDGEKSRKMYPYVVGMQYQIRPVKWDLLSDSGSVTVEPQVGSVLVTLGDITQVWSNGKLKKVRGRPMAPISEDGKSSISMTLLLTLPLETTVSPCLIHPHNNRDKDHKQEQGSGDNEDVIQSLVETSTSIYYHNNDNDNDNNNDNDNDDDDDNEDEAEHPRVFKSFTFEDYAWRVYHERLHLKDPLDRYRVIS